MLGRKERIARQKAAGERGRRWFGRKDKPEREVDDVKRAAWLARRNSRAQVHGSTVTQFDPRRRKPKRSRWVSPAERQRMRDSTKRKRAKADSARMKAESHR